MATLMESLAVVTSGPELIAGSMPILRKRKGRNRPRVVATIMAENIAVPNAKTIRAGWIVLSRILKLSSREHATPPRRPQLKATTMAMRTSRINTCPNLKAARWPVARPQTTIAEVCRPALPLMAAIMGTNEMAAA